MFFFFFFNITNVFIVLGILGLFLSLLATIFSTGKELMTSTDIEKSTETGVRRVFFSRARKARDFFEGT